MAHGYVPTNKEKLDWRLEIKTKKEYDLAVGSGIGWVLFPTLPLSWSEAEKEILAYQTKVEYCRKTRDSNFEASSRLEGIE